MWLSIMDWRVLKIVWGSDWKEGGGLLPDHQIRGRERGMGKDIFTLAPTSPKDGLLQQGGISLASGLFFEGVLSVSRWDSSFFPALRLSGFDSSDPAVPV